MRINHDRTRGNAVENDVMDKSVDIWKGSNDSHFCRTSTHEDILIVRKKKMKFLFTSRTILVGDVGDSPAVLRHSVYFSP